jgi:hypothetical protein
MTLDGVAKPLTCVSFASPYVGDEGWRAAFQVLEARGRLRHIRVSNEHDFVPLAPPPFVFKQWPKYCHTGVNLHLWPRGRFGIVKKPYVAYEGTRESIGDRMRTNWRWLVSGPISRLPLRLFCLFRSQFRGSFLLQSVMTLPILAVPVLGFPWIPAFCAARGFFACLFPWFLRDEWLYFTEGALADLDPSIKWGMVVGLGGLQISAILFCNTIGVLQFATHGLEDYHANMNFEPLQEGSVKSLYERYADNTLEQIRTELDKKKLARDREAS